jgi:hypothetical protein
MKKDLLTGEEFEPKKISQKFVNAKNRITYHNKKSNELRKKNAKLDKPLHINLKVLNELMDGKKEETFHDQFLLGKGFDFKVFNRLVTHKDKTYFCIYQYIKIHDNQHTKFIRDDRY